MLVKSVDMHYFKKTWCEAFGDSKLVEVTDAHSHTNISSPSAHVAESVSMRCEWTEGGS